MAVLTLAVIAVHICRQSGVWAELNIEASSRNTAEEAHGMGSMAAAQ